MATSTRKERIHRALDVFLDECLHPEKYDRNTGRLLYRDRDGYAYGLDPRPGSPLPAPRYRLMARLQLLTVLREWDIQLLKEILADEEAAADVKAHKEAQDALAISKESSA